MAQNQDSRVQGWFRETKKYEKPSKARALWQIINTSVPFLSLWAAIIWLLRSGQPYLLTLPLIIVAGLFMIRLFIIFHDCTHGSYFASATANRVVGTLLGILTFTPFADWRKAHSIHHANTANLDKRGVGDIWTLTLEEYRASKPSTRFWYRVYRNPIVLFLLVPPILFFILQRFPSGKFEQKSLLNLHITNIGIAVLAVALGLLGGWNLVYLVELPMFYIASIIGVWLFYVQHQFDPGYWQREEHWHAHDAAMLGSSHYKLPKVLQWISGNIGLHHIHHLRPHIPNYNLERCYQATPELQLANPLTIRTSFSSLNLHLWDEKHQTLIGFRAARHRLRRQTPQLSLS